MCYKNAKTPEAIQTEKYMHELYRLYQHEYACFICKSKRHDQFMNQWVHQMKTPISVIELLLQDDRPLDKKMFRRKSIACVEDWTWYLLMHA